MVGRCYFWLFKQSVTSLGTTLPSRRRLLRSQSNHLSLANFFNHWYVNCFRLLVWHHRHSIQIKDNAHETTQQQQQAEIDAMLAVINKNDAFTTGQYNVLRDVAAFPLVAYFNSKS